ncbi:MAG: rhodanese-like domain-containing protein [Thermodesulfobacteriota bacterium]
MTFLDRLRGVKTLEPEEARRWMEDRSEGSYVLLDVRQPREYVEAGHLPGAVLIPLPELPDRLAELDPAAPVLAY